MLLADKRHTGICDVVGRIQRYGINRRDPSMADFLIMRNERDDYEDARDLERPPGLPKLRRAFAGSDAAKADALAVTMHPSAAAGIGANMSLQQGPDTREIASALAGPGSAPPPAPAPRPGKDKSGKGGQKQGAWGATADSMAHIPGTGAVQGPTLPKQHADAQSAAQSMVAGGELPTATCAAPGFRDQLCRQLE